jgi:hypothetical protein
MRVEIFKLCIYFVLSFLGYYIIVYLTEADRVEFKKDSTFKGDEIDSTCSLYLPNNRDARVRKVYLMNLIHE